MAPALLRKLSSSSCVIGTYITQIMGGSARGRFCVGLRCPAVHTGSGALLDFFDVDWQKRKKDPKSHSEICRTVSTVAFLKNDAEITQVFYHHLEEILVFWRRLAKLRNKPHRPQTSATNFSRKLRPQTSQVNFTRFRGLLRNRILVKVLQMPFERLSNAVQMPKVDRNAAFSVTYPRQARFAICLRVRSASNPFETSRILSKPCGTTPADAIKVRSKAQRLAAFIAVSPCILVISTRNYNLKDGKVDK